MTFVSAVFLASCGNSAGGDSTPPPPRAPGLYEGAATTPAAGTATLPLALGWLASGAVDGGIYTIVINQNASLASQTLHYNDDQVQITLEGTGGSAARTVQLTGTGSLFTVGNKVSLKLDNGIKLQGVSDNTEALVKIAGGGKLEVAAGAAVTGNTSTNNGGGITALASGVCIISGGEVSGHSAPGRGGLYIGGLNARFEMTGGRISNNRATGTGGGAGMSLRDGAIGIMRNGEIRDNISGGSTVGGGGGGMRITGDATFTMEGGTITGNKVEGTNGGGGGGIYIANDATKVEFRGGTIANNTTTSTTVPSSFNVYRAGGTFVDNSGQALSSANGFYY